MNIANPNDPNFKDAKTVIRAAEELGISTHYIFNFLREKFHENTTNDNAILTEEQHSSLIVEFTEESIDAFGKSYSENSMTLKEFKQELIEYARTCIPEELKGLIRIPATSESAYLYLTNSNKEEVLELVEATFGRKSVSTQLAVNNDLPNFQPLKTFSLAGDSNKKPLETLFNINDIDEFKIKEKQSVKNNIETVLTNKKTSIYRLVLAANSKIKEAERSDYNKEFQSVISDLKENNLSGGKRKFFVAGHQWGNEDKLHEFLSENRWENGHDKKVTSAVNSAVAGDVVFIKSTWVKKKTQGMLTIKAVGVVKDNPLDGHNLIITWKELDQRIDLLSGSQYRRAFQRIQSDYLDQILGGILDHEAGLPNIIDELASVSQLDPVDDIRELIRSKLNSEFTFWWISDHDKAWGRNTSDFVGRNFHFKLIAGINSIPKKEDLIIVSNAVVGQIEGIFEVEKLVNENVQAIYKYEFQTKTTINELVENKVLYDAGFVDINLRGFETISQEIFQEIVNTTEISSKEGPTHIQNKAQKTKIDNDGAMAPKDFLGFENDIRAFSITLAQKRLVPPVAVALFGNWGTGKSFFMHHLEKNIDHLSEYQSFSNQKPKQESSKPFCEGVVQIKFNAWSYLDTNLWAGLIANIFEKLDEYVSGNNVIEAEKQNAQKIVADKLDIVTLEKKNIKVEIDQLTIKQEKLESELIDLEKSKETIYDSVKEKTLDELKKEARKQTEDLEETVKEQLDQYGISKQRIEELSPSVLLDEMTSWFTFAKNLGRFNKLQLGIGLVLIGLLVTFAIDPGNYLTELKEQLNAGLVYFIGIGGGIFSKVYSSYSKFKTLLKPVIDYKNNFNESFEKVKLDYDKSLISLNNKLTSTSAEIFDQKEKLLEVEKEIEKYNYDLEHSVTKRAFFDFIQRKANGESYESHLGLISLIRRDFEKLSGLFEEVNIPDGLPFDELHEMAIRENENNNFRKLFSKPLDRIVLYIDDLDRCDDDKVLEVLEAVHLLMAFPLFVVIVGVDKRCVSNALRYRNILKYTSKANVTPQELKDNFDIEVIEPEEYLEKIFQIPFRLKAANSDAIKGLIGNLLKNEIEQTPEDNQEEEIQEPSDQPILENNETKSKPTPTPKVPAQVAPEDLLITQTELDYLQEVSILVGDTPRTIKRFINIYRIIRAHEQLNYRKKERDLDFLIIMFVLGLGIGNCRNKSELLFKFCLNNTNKALEEILEIDSEEELNLLEIKKLIYKSETLKLLLSVPTTELNKYIQFVNRFSFNSPNA